MWTCCFAIVLNTCNTTQDSRSFFHSKSFLFCIILQLIQAYDKKWTCVSCCPSVSIELLIHTAFLQFLLVILHMPKGPQPQHLKTTNHSPLAILEWHNITEVQGQIGSDSGDRLFLTPFGIKLPKGSLGVFFHSHSVKVEYFILVPGTAWLTTHGHSCPGDG